MLIYLLKKKIFKNYIASPKIFCYQHDDFKAIALVTNPLSPWISREGKNPYRAITEGS